MCSSSKLDGHAATMRKGKVLDELGEKEAEENIPSTIRAFIGEKKLGKEGIRTALIVKNNPQTMKSFPIFKPTKKTGSIFSKKKEVDPDFLEKSKDDSFIGGYDL